MYKLQNLTFKIYIQLLLYKRLLNLASLGRKYFRRGKLFEKEILVGILRQFRLF